MNCRAIATYICVAIAAAALAPLISFAATPTFLQNHQLWDTGLDILSLQQWLNTNGYTVAQSGAGSPGQETETFGTHTYAALVNFQAAHDIPATGFFGPLTRAAVNALLASTNTVSSGATAPTAAPASSGAATSSPFASVATTSSTYVPGVTPLPGYAPNQIIFGGGPAPTPTPTCSISATPASIAIGSSTALTWSSTNAASASLNQSIGSVSTNGSQSVAPATNTTYTLTVTNSTGTNTCNTTVTATDEQAPTTPANLTAVAASLSELDLSWNASNDNGGGDAVMGYKIFRDGSQVATDTSGTTYADTGLSASSTHSYIVKAYDAAGNVSTASNTATSTTGLWADGFAGAPAGTAQYPNLLQGYATRPPWRVAGVDYAVGIPSSTTLSDPSTISGPGITNNCTSGSGYQYLRIDGPAGNSTVINGYDFSLHNGCGVLIVDASNVVVENSNFYAGSQLANDFTGIVFADASSSNLTVENNVFDGNGLTTQNYAALVVINGQGMTAKYNWLKNSYGQNIDVQGGGTILDEYNLIENSALGAHNHNNFVQFSGYNESIAQTFSSPQILFNTSRQTILGGNANIGAGEGLQVDAQSGASISSPNVANNVVIAIPQTGGSVAQALSYNIAFHNLRDNANDSNTGGTILSNYLDFTGSFGPFDIDAASSSMSVSTCSSNKNMSTGATIAGTFGAATCN